MHKYQTANLISIIVWRVGKIFNLYSSPCKCSANITVLHGLASLSLQELLQSYISARNSGPILDFKSQFKKYLFSLFFMLLLSIFHMCVLLTWVFLKRQYKLEMHQYNLSIITWYLLFKLITWFTWIIIKQTKRSHRSSHSHSNLPWIFHVNLQYYLAFNLLFWKDKQ